jgi:hypothetical protein
LLRVYSDNRVKVRFNHPDGSKGDSQYITTQPDFRVLIKGKPVRLSDVSTGQELTAYVHVTEPVIALAPVEATAPLEPVPMETEPPLAAMSTTASLLPTLAVIGALLLGMGGLLRRIRWRR